MPVKPKDGKKDFYQELQEVFSSHRTFGLQALRELKRAERYCEFLSLLTLDLAELLKSKPKFFAHLSGHQLNQAYLDLRDFITRSVRETDLVSGFEEHRLGLLLAETPQEGAKTLAKRLEEGIKYFLKEKLEFSASLPVPLKVISYPDKVKGREEMYSSIQEFLG